MSYLSNFPENVDYFITCRDEIYEEISRNAARDLGERVEVCIMPNVGMDVVPFLLLCREKELYTYDAVLKLHTKNQKSKLRSDQGKIVLDGLCGTKSLVNDVIELFQSDNDVGMVSTAFQLRSANALMYGNRARMASLLKKLEINLSEWPFITGTMFWVAGGLLREVSEMSPAFLEEALTEAESTTGGDGALAHTLERLFGALSASMAMDVFVTERRAADSSEFLVLPIREHGPANNWRFMEMGSADLVRRHTEANAWSKRIAASEYFDADYYQEISKPYAIPGMDGLYHFILYGDLFELNPSPDFDVTYYQLRRRDVVRETICSLLHFLQFGSREGLPSVPTEEDWKKLARNQGLFDPDWYKEKYGDVRYSGMNPEEHYYLIGRHLGRQPSEKFHPGSIPSISSRGGKDDDILTVFMKEFMIEENLLYAVLKRASQNGDYSLFSSVSKRIQRKFGTSRAINEALATSYTMSGDWEKARMNWDAFWKEAKPRIDSCRHGTTVLQFDHFSKDLEGFSVVQSVDGKIWENDEKSLRDGKKICIYTTLFGEIDKLNPVINPVKGIDYICFTDRERDAKGWTQIIVDPKQPTDNLNAKVFKVLPHQHLQNYEYSMFVDANTVFLGRTGELIDICLSGGDFVMWQHPLREDTLTEVCAIISHLRHGPEKILEQIQHYVEQGLPRNAGVFEASFIWRRHMSPDVSNFMDKWWEHICKFSSRDQISLSYLVWETGMRPSLLDKAFGTSRENVFFFKAPHLNGVRSQETDDLTTVASPTVIKKVRDITFLFHEEFSGTGSTILRGQQLSQIVSEKYDGVRSVSYSSEISDIRNQLVVLNKGFLKKATPEQLNTLGKNNLLIADFVDEPPKRDLVAEVDGLMASSLLGYKDYLNSFPDIPAFHVTHHVDTRIPRCENSRSDVFKGCYFGELVNTVRDDEIEEFIDFNLVDTSKQADDWIEKIPHYNFHYAFRQTRGIDGAKPFLKGFVAAHCGANMMIQKSAGDASFYLGTDYPYLMEDGVGIDEITEALRFAKDTIGGPEWRYGREIMRDVQDRSSLQHVLKEFDDMLIAMGC